MGYKVPDWKKSIDQNKFDVEVDGKTFQLPKAEYMTGNQVVLLATMGKTPAGMYDVLDGFAPGLGEALRAVPMKYVTEMVTEWQKESGITLGESSASSNS